MNRLERIGASIFLFLSLLLFIWAAWGYAIPVTPLRWTVIVAGLALALLGWTFRSPWRAFGCWTALALVGQACALQLLAVGRQNRLQLFHGWEHLLTTYYLVFLAAVVIQAGLVLWGGRQLWKVTPSRCRVHLTAGQLTLLLVLCAFTTVPVAPETVQALLQGDLLYRLSVQASKVALGLLIFGAGGLNLVLAVAAIPSGAWEKATAWWKESDRRWLPGACAVWVILASSLLAWFVFERLPHVPDEVAYLFHAKYFAAGRLYLPMPPEPAAFSCSLMLFDGPRWFSAQLPGWPLVLALGAWAGVPWLVNPLLGGLAILLAHSLVRRLYGNGVADGTILLLACSPWLLYMSASLFGHPVSLVFALAGLLGVERVRKTGSLGGALAAGVCFGMLAAVRPIEALALATVAGIWWLSAGWKRIRIAALAVTMISGVGLVGLQLAYNQMLTGDPFYFPFEKIFDQAAYPGSNRVGFGADVGNLGWEQLDPLPGHGPIDVIVNTNHNLYMVNFDLFGWACGSLLFVFWLLKEGRNRRDQLMWALLLAIWLGLSPYWFSGGPDIGARYWYQMIVPLAVLTVRGAQEFAERWGRNSGGAKEGSGSKVWAFVALACMVALVNVMPWRAADKYRSYRGVRGDVRRLEQQYHFGRSLVFIRGEKPRLPWLSSTYASALALNPLTLDRNAPGPIYVRDLGPASRQRLQSYYADRPVWILAGPQLTGDRFQVLEGPLPPRSREPD